MAVVAAAAVAAAAVAAVAAATTEGLAAGVQSSAARGEGVALPAFDEASVCPFALASTARRRADTWMSRMTPYAVVGMTRALGSSSSCVWPTE